MAMASLLVDDDKDLDDAALWALIDSAAAAAAAASYSSYSTTTTTSTAAANSRFRKPLTQKNPNLRSSPQILLPSSPPNSHQKLCRTPRHYTLHNSPRVPVEDWAEADCHRPQKIAKSSFSEMSKSSPDLQIVKRVPVTPVYSSPESGKFSVKELSPYTENHSPHIDYRHSEYKEKFTHCLAGRFPTVSLFKDYQDAAIKILEKSDYTIISGNPFIKKSGWRKIAFYFNISFEIKDKSIEFDENRNVQRAEFVVRAYMQGGRFSDGWGSCERREKRFLKPNNDVPSTAETRAKNKACQDLLGIGAYRTSVSQ